LSGRGLCDELITRPEESYRLCCVVVCDLETSRIGAPYIYIYDVSNLRVKVCHRILQVSSNLKNICCSRCPQKKKVLKVIFREKHFSESHILLRVVTEFPTLLSIFIFRFCWKFSLRGLTARNVVECLRAFLKKKKKQQTFYENDVTCTHIQ